LDYCCPFCYCTRPHVVVVTVALPAVPVTFTRLHRSPITCLRIADPHTQDAAYCGLLRIAVVSAYCLRWSRHYPSCAFYRYNCAYAFCGYTRWLRLVYCTFRAVLHAHAATVTVRFHALHVYLTFTAPRCCRVYLRLPAVVTVPVTRSSAPFALPLRRL